jgi:hypothetical protein
MSDRSFDLVSRRMSRAALLAAAITTWGTPFTATARKRKNGKGKDKQAKRKCKTQVRQCTALVAAECGTEDEICQDLLECCQVLGQCDFAGFMNCGVGAEG